MYAQKVRAQDQDGALSRTRLWAQKEEGPPQRREKKRSRSRYLLDYSVSEAHGPRTLQTGKKCSHNRQARGEIRSDPFWHQSWGR